MLKSDPEKTRAWQQRSRKGLAKRSKKQQGRMAKAKAMYELRFKEHPFCEVPICIDRATDPHHHTTLKRHGEGLFRFRCICAAHHFYIHHVNPGQARAEGLLDCLTSDDWAKPFGGRKEPGRSGNLPGSSSV
jgi:hypothetical protein